MNIQWDKQEVGNNAPELTDKIGCYVFFCAHGCITMGLGFTPSNALQLGPFEGLGILRFRRTPHSVGAQET